LEIVGNLASEVDHGGELLVGVVGNHFVEFLDQTGRSVVRRLCKHKDHGATTELSREAEFLAHRDPVVNTAATLDSFVRTDFAAHLDAAGHVRRIAAGDRRRHEDCGAKKTGRSHEKSPSQEQQEQGDHQ
jgi:hypothetical protein